MAERYRVIWAPSALGDLEEILSWAEDEKPGRAVTVAARIEAAASRLDRLPARGRLVPELRELGIPFFRELVVTPWHLVYRIDGREVRVVALFDGRRDPAEMLLRRLLRTE